MSVTSTELIVASLFMVWSAAFLIATVVAVCSGDPSKRADARKVMRLLRSPWLWIIPRSWFGPDDDAAR
jgi:hypothetical protein